MVHPVKGLKSTLLRHPSLLDVGLQLVKGFGHDKEVRVLEEEGVDTASHLASLSSSLRIKVLIDKLGRVAKLHELRAHLLSLPC